MRHEELDVDTETQNFQTLKIMRHFKHITDKMNWRQDKLCVKNC